jgi:hypothetical protein
VGALVEEKRVKEVSEESFPIPEKLYQFLTNILERWKKITKKNLERGINVQNTWKFNIDPVIFRINFPDYILIKKGDHMPDPKYKGYYIATLGYPTYKIYLHIGEIKEGEFELIAIDVEDRETCRCICG